MEERDRRRQELMREISARFRNSAAAMMQIAKRIGEAAKIDKSNHRRFEKTARPLGKCVEAKPENLPFTYLEFLEFSSAEEFRRFRDQPAISAEDIDNLDWNRLAEDLFG